MYNYKKCERMKSKSFLTTMLLMLTTGMVFTSCSSGGVDKNAESIVVDVMEKNIEAHTILFFDPSTTKVLNGNTTKNLMRLDYIVFCTGYVRVKFLGKEEMTFEPWEPNHSKNGVITYKLKRTDNEFSISLTNGCTFVYDDVSYSTGLNQVKLNEYMNLRHYKYSRYTFPLILDRMLKAHEKKDGYYYF